MQGTQKSQTQLQKKQREITKLNTKAVVIKTV